MSRRVSRAITQMCNHLCGAAGPGEWVLAHRDEDMRTVRRPRRYVARHWIVLLRPLLRYSQTRGAFVLRGVGSSMGPVLRVDRRSHRSRSYEDADRRQASVA